LEALSWYSWATIGGPLGESPIQVFWIDDDDILLGGIVMEAYDCVSQVGIVAFVICELGYYLLSVKTS
jgi:hypothetical protein